MGSVIKTQWAVTKIKQTLSSEEQASKVRRITSIGLLTNLVLSAGKLLGGVFGNSLAVTVDGVHSLSDCTTDLAILLGVKYWSRPPDACHPYGHKRTETLVTIFIGFALVITAAGMSWNAVVSFGEPGNSAPGIIALIAAASSIVIKEVLFRVTRRAGKHIGSSALLANAWHQRTDALSSIPVTIAVIAARLHPDLIILDSIGALLVSIFIFVAAWRIIAPGISQLADRAAPQEETAKISAAAAGVSGVRDVHAVRTRYYGMGILVDLHITVDPEITVRAGHDIATSVQQTLMSAELGVEDVVVHIEPEVE